MNDASMLRNKTAALAFGALLAATLPWWAGDQYQLHLAALICVYWILIAGLNLVVGYTGQLSIGHVGLLMLVLLLKPEGLLGSKNVRPV